MSERQPTLRWSRFRRLARKQLAAILACALAALLVGATFSAVRLPVPKVHDEFSYLLAADTFAKGRVTNPSHPLWEHFESFHVIQQPSYASKYQPGQGLVLALGQTVGGHPIVGAWIASAIAAAAMCWMLQGWVPPRWALLGGLLVALHGIMQVRWSLSYWGGSLPLAGGALMFGALPRIQRKPSASTALLMASGAVLLAATRPFEGFVVGLTVAAALLVWMFGHRSVSWGTVLCKVVIPSATVLGLGIAALGYYNLRVTGDPLRMPYQVHENQYGYSPLFLWQSPEKQPEYRHEVMQAFQTGWAIEDYQEQQSLDGFLAAKTAGLKSLIGFFCVGTVWVPLLMLKLLLANQQLRFVWIALAVSLLAQMSVPWLYPHYFAPAVPLVFLLIVMGMRYLAVLPRRGHAWTRLVVPAVLVIHVAALPFLLVQYVNLQPEGWEWNRARIAEQLDHMPGKHLVLVSYGPEHNGHAEWVYNRANIDTAKVVWARPMGPEKDAKLLDYFQDRSVWLVNGDAERPDLVASSVSRQRDVLSAALSNRKP